MSRFRRSIYKTYSEPKAFVMLGRRKPGYSWHDLAVMGPLVSSEFFESEVECSNCGKVFPDGKAAEGHTCMITPENLAEILKVVR